MTAKEETVSLFKKLLAAIIYGFQTKDRSKSDRSHWYRYYSAEKHGRAQVSACVIIIFVNGCRNEVDLILPRASMFAPLRKVLGFHMTSQKFKLRNYRFFWVSTISVQKGSSFCDPGPGRMNLFKIRELLTYCFEIIVTSSLSLKMFFATQPRQPATLALLNLWMVSHQGSVKWNFYERKLS